MKAVFNDESEKWHLLGARGCGARPDGETIDASWSKIRDRVERDTGSRCKNCDWP
jgi:hypothetical protein